MKTNLLLLAERNKNIPQGPFNTHPIFAEKAKGAIIIDVEGKEYIDFAGGIGVNNVGHCNEEVMKAVQDQMQKYIHTCFHVVMYEPYVELAKRLNDMAGRQRSFIPMEKNETGRRNVQGESKQGRDQEDGGERRKFQGLDDVQGGQ